MRKAGVYGDSYVPLYYAIAHMICFFLVRLLLCIKWPPHTQHGLVKEYFNSTLSSIEEESKINRSLLVDFLPTGFRNSDDVVSHRTPCMRELRRIFDRAYALVKHNFENKLCHIPHYGYFFKHLHSHNILSKWLKK